MRDVGLSCVFVSIQERSEEDPSEQKITWHNSDCDPRETELKVIIPLQYYRAQLLLKL